MKNKCSISCTKIKFSEDSLPGSPTSISSYQPTPFSGPIPIARSEKHVVLTNSSPVRPRVSSMQSKLDHTKIDTSLYQPVSNPFNIPSSRVHNGKWWLQNKHIINFVFIIYFVFTPYFVSDMVTDELICEADERCDGVTLIYLGRVACEAGWKFARFIYPNSAFRNLRASRKM